MVSAGLRPPRHIHLSPSNQPLTFKSNRCRDILKVLAPWLGLTRRNRRAVAAGY
jgi:hypothetical protein